MAGIYISGMKMPKEGSIEIAILAEGIAIETGHTVRVDGKDYYTPTLGEKPSTNAIEVPDHGRLIDAQKFAAVMHERYNNAYSWYMEAEDPEIKFRAASVVASVTECSLILSKMPTVIPADKE